MSDPTFSSSTESGSAGRVRDSYGVEPRGFRLPTKARLGRVSLQISDLERSLEYYQKVLGLGVRSRAAQQAVLAAQDAGRPLVELHQRPGARDRFRARNGLKA